MNSSPTRYLIFSTDNEQVSPPAVIESVQRKFEDLGILCLQVLGSYKGKNENSYLIVTENNPQFEAAERAVRMFTMLSRQESYLVVDSNRYCVLYSGQDGRFLQGLGTWIQTDKPEQYDAWTKIGQQYYTAK